jgi:hypothetical protein
MKFSSSIKTVIIFGMSVVLLQASSIAQSASPKRLIGKLEGVVVDTNEARIVKASVKIEGRRIKREVISNEEGLFQVELPVGMYQITVYSPGFGVFQRKGVKVQANSTTKVEIPLKVAAVGPCPDAKSKGKGLVICM